MKLQKGITGFDNHREKGTAPVIDEKLLKECAHQKNYSTAYKLINLQKPQPSSNYFKISYKHLPSDEQITLVVNAHYPYLAGINAESNWMNLYFVTLPNEVKQILEKAGFTYLAPELLNSAFNKDDLDELSESEIEQITYWKSKTFGEVIFNGYD